ncbi:TRAP transporter substrate-binding protein [Halomonas organivorans]|uniref:TRAP-type mannitol/chloroaromatic compound transport system substrate-binding protein n=1 Tax=Halomonas organivorans TaxID=257772 RepID=A0A7W5BW18_9GAMM|nr:TRAP transporter substrate-binding protein [Halomonas organivorans]MBB3139869.1 TRAP-type mannitol/chloroaromatic compound transport system substrate-binding protein [Halomonas organivorans]
MNKSIVKTNMTNKNKSMKNGLIIVGSVVSLLSAGVAQAQETRTLRMHAAFPTQAPVIGEISPWLAERIEKLTGGSLEVDVFEPGALVPATDYYDAVSQGAVDMAFGTPGYGSGLEPALNIFTAVPFGPDVTEYMAWMREGGGQELHDEILEGMNLKGFVCTLTAPETAGWTTREFNTPEDFSGAKLRYFGLGGRVLAKLGASIQMIPGSEVYSALELGVIDGGEYSNPSIDVRAGLDQVTDYAYFPGWHQQVAIDTLIINLDTWNELSEQQQLAIETTCGEATMRTLTQGAAAQPAAVQALAEDDSVEIKVWSDEIMDALETAWEEVAEEESAKNETFARVMDSYNSFREQYAKWQKLGYLKPETDE